MQNDIASTIASVHYRKFISVMSNPVCVGFLCETSDGDGIIWLFHYLLTMNILTNAFTQGLLSSHWERKTELKISQPNYSIGE